MAKIQRSYGKEIRALQGCGGSRRSHYLGNIWRFHLSSNTIRQVTERVAFLFFNFSSFVLMFGGNCGKFLCFFATVPSEDSQSPKQLCMEKEGNLTAKNISQVGTIICSYTYIDPPCIQLAKRNQTHIRWLRERGGGRIWREVRLCWICCYFSWNATIVSASVTMASADLHALMNL